RAIGWSSPETSIGKQFNYGGRRGFITGVMKDFHFESLHHPIVPIVFMISIDRSNLVSIRVDAVNRDATMAFLKEEWQQLRPDYPFIPPMTERSFNRQYEAEQRLKTIFTFFVGLAVLLSILVLFGVATLDAE